MRGGWQVAGNDIRGTAERQLKLLCSRPARKPSGGGQRRGQIDPKSGLAQLLAPLRVAGTGALGNHPRSELMVRHTCRLRGAGNQRQSLGS